MSGDDATRSGLATGRRAAVFFLAGLVAAGCSRRRIPEDAMIVTDANGQLAGEADRRRVAAALETLGVAKATLEWTETPKVAALEY